GGDRLLGEVRGNLPGLRRRRCDEEPQAEGDVCRTNLQYEWHCERIHVAAVTEEDDVPVRPSESDSRGSEDVGPELWSAPRLDREPGGLCLRRGVRIGHDDVPQ